MASNTLPRIHTLPIGATLEQARPVRTLLLWAAMAAVTGALIGLAVDVLVSVLTDRPLDAWFVGQSIVFAEAVALSALAASRYAFPMLEPFAPFVRYVLALLAIVGGSVTITAASLVMRPGVVFSRPVTFLALVAANTVLAIVVGGALMTWDHMKRSLARAYEELRVKEAFEREMSLAREVQRGLLPEAPPRVPGYDIAFRCRTAALVGGDTLDFVPLDGGRIGLAIGDVSGKGIAAALLMANVQALVRALATFEDEPRRLNAALSEAVLSRAVAGRYVTFAYLVLDPPTGGIRYSLGGHHPPVIVGRSGVRLLDRGGVPLGLLPGCVFDGGEDVLGPGETLLVYTDGLVEAPSGDGEEREFGRERVLALCREFRGDTAEHLVERLLRALDDHVGDAPPADDTTILVVHRSGDDPVARAHDGNTAAGA